jgi:hypothetical protein
MSDGRRGEHSRLRRPSAATPSSGARRLQCLRLLIVPQCGVAPGIVAFWRHCGGLDGNKPRTAHGQLRVMPFADGPVCGPRWSRHRTVLVPDGHCGSGRRDEYPRVCELLQAPVFNRVSRAPDRPWRREDRRRAGCTRGQLDAARGRVSRRAFEKRWPLRGHTSDCRLLRRESTPRRPSSPYRSPAALACPEPPGWSCCPRARASRDGASARGIRPSAMRAWWDRMLYSRT